MTRFRGSVARVALGVPLENPFSISDAGGELALCGSLFADGFETGPGELPWSDIAR
jgi:hypothetical protein